MPSEYRFEILKGRLPAGYHHFTILVCEQSANDEVRYFELKPKYFGKHSAKPAFKLYWSHVVRVAVDVSLAVTWRAKKILARAHIKPLEAKYMTTAVMLSKDNSTIRYRHVVGVKLTSMDLNRLKSEGMLRELYRGDASAKDKLRDALFGILPIAGRAQAA